MGAAAREAILSWAANEDTYVVEDDYDGEFWLSDNRPGSLFSQADKDQVIYFNSFSKTLFPSLRVSYLALPEALIRPVTSFKTMFDPHVSAMAELALTEFIASGAYNTHLRKMRALYRERYNILRYTLETKMADQIRISSRQFGLHLCVELDPQYVDRDISAEMQSRRFGCKALSNYYLSPYDKSQNGLILGYAGWEAQDLTHAVAVLQSLCR